MVTVVAIFLFLICETTLSFVFYFTGFLLVLTLVNLWYLTSQQRMYEQGPTLRYGENLITQKERRDQLQAPSLVTIDDDDDN